MSAVELFAIVAEGCVDYFCGRPLDRNPYCPIHAADHHWAWAWGWNDASDLLEQRGQEEAARWLREAA